MPRKFILQLDKILGDFEGKVKIVCSDTQVSFEADNFIIITFSKASYNMAFS